MCKQYKVLYFMLLSAKNFSKQFRHFDAIVRFYIII